MAAGTDTLRLTAGSAGERFSVLAARPARRARLSTLREAKPFKASSRAAICVSRGYDRRDGGEIAAPRLAPPSFRAGDRRADQQCARGRRTAEHAPL